MPLYVHDSLTRSLTRKQLDRLYVRSPAYYTHILRRTEVKVIDTHLSVVKGRSTEGEREGGREGGREKEEEVVVEE